MLNDLSKITGQAPPVGAEPQFSSYTASVLSAVQQYLPEGENASYGSSNYDETCIYELYLLFSMRAAQKAD